jgi:hypothetical protein
MNINPFRRRVAKRLFHLSTKLEWLKTPSRTYEWNENLDEPGWKFAGWTMLPQPAIHLMERSWNLDPGHWDHWAVDHDECEPAYCAVCGGCFCDDRKFLDHH